LSVFPFSNQVPDISNTLAEEITLPEDSEHVSNSITASNISEHPVEDISEHSAVDMSDTNDRFVVIQNWCFVLVPLATLCIFCLFRPGLNDIYALVRSPVSNPIETSEDPLTGHF
jgi:hypothetical protein